MANVLVPISVGELVDKITILKIKQSKIDDDEKLILDILEREQILLVQGSAFNVDDVLHFRVVFLPREEDLRMAIGKLARVLDSYRIN